LHRLRFRRRIYTCCLHFHCESSFSFGRLNLRILISCSLRRLRHALLVIRAFRHFAFSFCSPLWAACLRCHAFATVVFTRHFHLRFTGGFHAVFCARDIFCILHAFSPSLHDHVPTGIFVRSSPGPARFTTLDVGISLCVTLRASPHLTHNSHVCIHFTALFDSRTSCTSFFHIFMHFSFLVCPHFAFLSTVLFGLLFLIKFFTSLVSTHIFVHFVCILHISFRLFAFSFAFCFLHFHREQIIPRLGVTHVGHAVVAGHHIYRTTVDFPRTFSPHSFITLHVIFGVHYWAASLDVGTWALAFATNSRLLLIHTGLHEQRFRQ